MKESETRVTSATGGQKGQKDVRLGGADPLAMIELGRVYGMGEQKYDRFNYLKGYPWSLSVDALKRHLLAFEAGEDYDECSVHPGQHDADHEYDPAACDGSGLLHTAHVAWHGMTLTSFVMRHKGQDDRYRDEPELSEMDQMIGLGLRSRAFYLDMLGIEGDPEREVRAVAKPVELCACHKPGVSMGEEHRTFVYLEPNRAKATLVSFRNLLRENDPSD